MTEQLDEQRRMFSLMQEQQREAHRQAMMSMLPQSPEGNYLSGYVEAPSYQGVDSYYEEGPYIGYPSSLVASGAPYSLSPHELKYHPAKERWLLYSENTYRLPGVALRKNMIHELTEEQYKKIHSISADWAHIAKPGRSVDRETVGALAKSLFGDITVTFTDDAPRFNDHCYRKLIDADRVRYAMQIFLWVELSNCLQEQLVPAEYELFLRGTQRDSGTKADKNTKEGLRSYLQVFMTLDYARRVLQVSELEPYANILLFVRSVGGFFFENPTSLIIYDYPTAVHSSKEFGGREVLHNPEGPAIQYGADKGLFAIEGFEFAPRVVLRRDTITVQEIEAESNMERRRILTDQMGIARYLHETNAKVIDMDGVRVMTVGSDDRRMPRALIEAKDGRRFLCGTDGSTKRVYYMPVPRDVTTCRMAHEAIAGPVGVRRMEVARTRDSGFRGTGILNLGLDEKDCIAQS